MDSDRPARSDAVGGEASAQPGPVSLLVGRERELAELSRRLDAPDGPGLVLVHGERGAGRSAFARAAVEELRTRGRTVLSLGCAEDDQEHPLLLALRVIAAARKHRSAAAPQGAVWAPDPESEVLSAVERGDQAALAETLLSVLAYDTGVAVVVDDAQYADTESLDVLSDLATAQGSAPDLRVVVALTGAGHPGGGAERWAQSGSAWTICLPRLATQQLAEWVARRWQAVPDPALVDQVFELTRGIPAAADALLTEWAEQNAVRIADGHAFLAGDAPVPVLPDDDRFMRALYALGEPCRTVAAALSVLWPLGREAVWPAVDSTGLSGREFGDGVQRLVAAGLVDELPGEAEGTVRGWMFRSPLVEHAVRERLGPLERARLSAAGVRALWAVRDGSGAKIPAEPPTVLVAEADAETYLPDRIADAGVLLDRDRSVAELTAAADRLYPDPGNRGMLRWLRAALLLVEEPAAREQALLQYTNAAWVAGDHETAGRTAETILRDPSDVVSGPELQEMASLPVVAAAAAKDWSRLARMGSATWWDGMPLPPQAVGPARALALCMVERWQEALDLLRLTEETWRTDPHTRVIPELVLAVGDMVQGRTDLLTRGISTPPSRELPPGAVYGMTTAHSQQLLGAADLYGVLALLRSRGMAPEALPPGSRFLLLHLQGRWDEALALARRMVAKDEAFTAAPHHHLFTARMAAILVARGKTAGAGRLIADARGSGNGPLEIFLDLADSGVLRTMGDASAAERTLRRGLRAADARGYVHGTDELSAALAEVLADTGRTGEATAYLRRLADLAQRTGSERTRLLYLLASARVLGRDGTQGRAMLHEAVELARSRGQPFETAVTLESAAGHSGPPKVLHEAYELFGETGSLLRRFHARTAMREAGLTVTGRRQATAENERLLATLITEGLSNRQIATVLRLSEDAVANRLSRLFARTGLRSRTEVVSAVLTGRPLSAHER